MSLTLKLVLTIGLIIYFVLIIYFLKKKALQLKYTLTWIGAGVFMALLVAFPELLAIIVAVLGIETQMYGLFVMCLCFIMIILMSVTSIVSKQSERIRKMVQYTALLEERIRILEENDNK